jgi:sialate O-acetylesterase
MTLVTAVLALVVTQCHATLSLPSVFGSDMVLPASPRAASIWGTTGANASVSVNISGALSANFHAVADKHGMFRVTLGVLPVARESSQLVISSDSSKAVLTGVVFGDLVLCGGQSNMQFSLNGAFNATAEIETAGNYSKRIRLMTVKRVSSKVPVISPALDQQWSRASPNAVDDGKDFGVFSAECYLAGRKLVDMHPSTPVGLISACWSGSMIQPWMTPDALQACPNAKAKGGGSPFNDGQYYNGMIHPLLGFEMAAVLWHQGEENSGDAAEYACYFPALINDWRAKFNMPALPFVFVQLQPCNIPPEMRYAQTAALALANTGMAVAYDLGDANNTKFGMCHR